MVIAFLSKISWKISVNLDYELLRVFHPVAVGLILSPLSKAESKVCWACWWGEKFMVKVKKMWKDSEFKVFTLFYNSVILCCYKYIWGSGGYCLK